MHEWNKRSHVTWYCLYHVVFIPKYCKKCYLEEFEQKEEVCFENCAIIKLVKGHVMSDHIHMSLSISQDMEWHRR